MKDVYEDMEACREMILELHDAIVAKIDGTEVNNTNQSFYHNTKEVLSNETI